MFNDPYDCFFSLEPKFNLLNFKKNYLERFVEIFAGPIQPAFDSNARTTFAELRKTALSFEGTPDELRKMLIELFERGVEMLEGTVPALRRNWQDEVANYRVFCVCEKNDNPLLWSHYAQEHRGAAFQLECLEALDVPLLAANRVEYGDEPPDIGTEEEWFESIVCIRRPEDWEKTWIRMVTTKGREWEHECEWRVISHRRPGEPAGYVDSKFDPREISKLFLGCRITEHDREELLNLLTGEFSHVKAFQARQDNRSYRLQFDPIN